MKLLIGFYSQFHLPSLMNCSSICIYRSSDRSSYRSRPHKGPPQSRVQRNLRGYRPNRGEQAPQGSAPISRAQRDHTGEWPQTNEELVIKGPCFKCKSAEGELRACSFCKTGIYHDTAECLGEERGPETSLAYKSFPWCCPKCFKKGTAALEKTLLAPMQPTAAPRQGGKRTH